MTLIEERTIALAGVIQACTQVQTLARKGEADNQVFDASLKSILVLDAVNTEAVYSGLHGVNSGLRTLSNGLMSSASMEDVELLRYVMSILNLQSQLYRDDNAFTKFGIDVERLSSAKGEELVLAASNVYREHVSCLRPQIIVQGEEEFLQRADTPAKIRTMLLAAFRSAVLWQQKGGGKFKIMWERTRMRNAAQTLLNS